MTAIHNEAQLLDPVFHPSLRREQFKDWSYLINICMKGLWYLSSDDKIPYIFTLWPSNPISKQLVKYDKMTSAKKVTKWKHMPSLTLLGFSKFTGIFQIRSAGMLGNSYSSCHT